MPPRLLGLLGALLLGISAAQDFPPSDFPLSDVTPGLSGHGLSAGPGNTLERFEAEVLGFMDDAGLGFPLVLVRVGGAFIEASGGVAAGMSGSPVYLPRSGQDALLGAIGYVFPQSDHRLALVTPIAAMRGASVAAPPAALLNAEAVAALGPVRPVTTPLLISGLSARASARLEPLFREAGLEPFPVQMSSRSSFDEAGYRLEPGSAISVQLVSGDVTIAAIGTVTSLGPDGSLLAFGHPLLASGEVSYALAPAFVSAIVPSSVVPFKLANSGQTRLGAITQDRPAAVLGRLGLEPDVLPVTLTLETPTGVTLKRFEITRDERYYAPLLAVAALQLLDTALGQLGAGTSAVAWDIGLGTGAVQTLEQTTDPSDIALTTAALVAAPLALLAKNPFSPPQVSRLSVHVKLEPAQRYAEIARVALEDEHPQPGQAVIARVRLQPFRAQPQIETLTLNLPPGTEGEVELRFWGGLTPPEPDPEARRDPLRDTIFSFGELLAAMRNQVQSQELVVDALIAGDLVRLARLSLPFLVKGEERVVVTVGGPLEGTLLEPAEADPDAPPPPDSSPPLYP